MAKKEIKLQTRVTDFDAVSKNLNEIEKTLNTLLSLTTQTAEGATTEGNEGETGEIKAINNPDKTYSFNIKTDDGWKVPVWKGQEITFNDKPKKEAVIKKTITEIEADDISTGNNKAKNTIYDESSGEFSVQHLTTNQTGGLMKPDWDSGWLYFLRDDARVHEDPPMRMIHNLGVFPSLVKVYFAPNQGSGSLGAAVDESAIGWFTEADTDMGSGYNHGMGTYISKTDVRLHAADEQTLVSSNFSLSSSDHRVTYQNGSVRVLLWK
jgi:hypothetical protein